MSMVKQRRDINTLSDADLSDYVHALDILRQRSAVNHEDPTGYEFQAGLHNDSSIGPCEHGSDLFLPWHRAHLYYFERLLQESDPPRTATITIPYWDWIHPEQAGKKFPPAFSQPGLSQPGRNPRLNPPSLPSNTLRIVTDERRWNEFGGYPHGGHRPGDLEGDFGRLEWGPHNFMHPEFIGGQMAHNTSAANDAIYFSFHCFIDLLWAEWQRRNGTPAPTSPDADLRGFDPQSKHPQPLHQVRDFHSTVTLGYEYEYTEKLKSAFAISSPTPVPHELLVTNRLQPFFEGSEAEELRKTARLQFGFPPLSKPGAAAVVRLQQLKVPTTGSYRLDAYVHPKEVPFDPNDAEFVRRYFVEYVAQWQAHGSGMGHGGHEGSGHHPSHPQHPSSLTARFDVTKVLGGATAEATADQVLTLHYVPAPDPAGEPTPGPALLEDVTLNDVLVEVYG
jgi:Common central domain of tyrosinase